MAAPRSGLSAQAMIKTETTVNTYVAPTDGLWLVSESIKREVQKIKSNAIVATRRLMTADQHYNGNETIAGPLHVELTDLGAEHALALLWGAPVKTGGGPTYTRTWAGPLDLFGASATLQIGRPDVSGTVQPFTFTGLKATGGEIGLSVGEVAVLSADTVAMNEILVRTVADGVTNTDTALTSATAVFTPDDVGKPVSGTGIPAATTISAYVSATAVTLSAATTATATGVTITIGVALASAAYTASMKPFTFIGGSVTASSVTVGGAAPSAVKKATLKVSRPQDTDRRGIGSARILQPIENELGSVKLELDCEFDGLTHYRRYIANSEHAAVLTLVSGTNTLTITMNGYYEMPPDPKVDGAGIVRQTIGLDMAGSTDAAAFTAVLVNTVA